MNEFGTATTEALAELLGITARRIQQLSAAGIIPRVARCCYDVREAATAYLNYLARAKQPGRQTRGLILRERLISAKVLG